MVQMFVFFQPKDIRKLWKKITKTESESARFTIQSAFLFLQKAKPEPINIHFEFQRKKCNI